MCHVEFSVVFHDKVVDDEQLTFHCVLAHIEFEHILYGVFFTPNHRVKTHIRTDEAAEFVRRYFPQSFEPGYLRVAAELLYRGNALLVGVAVERVGRCVFSFLPFVLSA